MDIETIINELKKQDPREAHITAPLALLQEYEQAGFSTDGAVFEENGERLVNLQKSFVFDNAEALVFDPQDPAVLTRSAFRIQGCAHAVLRITALGYFIAYLNGKRITDGELMPPKTDYEPRDLTNVNFPIFDTLSHRIYYYEYDVTSLLRNGDNALCAHIGAGWYADAKNPAERMPKWGNNMLLFSLLITDTDGKVTEISSSPSNTVWQKSWVRDTSLYYGEYHDYTFYDAAWNTPEYDDSEWKRPNTRPAPQSFFQLADFPADAACGEIIPKEIRRRDGHVLYDLGEIASGWPVVESNDKNRPNVRIILRFGDVLNEDGSFALRHTGGDWREQTDCFLLSPAANDISAHPLFTWNASRYIELTGNGTLVKFIKVHTPLKQTGFFESDNETLNWLFKAYVNTQTANFHGCIPSDCPHRERLGYTGDGQLCSAAAMRVFDMRAAYRKWMRDIRDCQDIYNGHVQHTAPFYGGGGGPGGWGGAAVIVPWRYYEAYNDLTVLRESYHSMQAYIRYMMDHCENGLVTHGEKGGWCLGDWCPPNNDVQIPAPFVNTYFLIKCADIVKKTSLLLNRKEEAAYYDILAKSVTSVFVRTYYDEDTGSFCGGIQGADAFAIDLGLGDERTRRNLINKYSALGEFDTGIFGTDLLIRTLFQLNEGSLAFRLLTNESENSFYNMKRGDTNTLWENWDGCDSRCHPMFGAVVEYLFSEIAGIKRYNGAPGYGDIEIRPADIPELKELHCTFRVPEGFVSVDVTTSPDGEKIVRYTADGEITVHCGNE